MISGTFPNTFLQVVNGSKNSILAWVKKLNLFMCSKHLKDFPFYSPKCRKSIFIAIWKLNSKNLQSNSELSNKQTVEKLNVWGENGCRQKRLNKALVWPGTKQELLGYKVIQSDTKWSNLNLNIAHFTISFFDILIYEVVYVPNWYPAFCLTFHLTGVHFLGKLQHIGDISEQKSRNPEIKK